MIFNIEKPVGMNELVNEIERICANPRPYRQYGVSMPMFLLDMASGNGRSTAVEFVSAAFIQYGVYGNNGSELYREVSLSGAPQMLRKNMILAGRGIYTDLYQGVITADITPLAARCGEQHIDVFISELSRWSNSSTVLLFCDSKQHGAAELKSKLLNGFSGNGLIRRLREIKVTPYPVPELAEIALAHFDRCGVAVAERSRSERLLIDRIKAEGIKTAAEVCAMADELLLRADFTKQQPSLLLAPLFRIDHSDKSETIKSILAVKGER